MKGRILLIDDEPLLRLNLRKNLEFSGYEVVGEGSDGFEAIELCKRYRPDLVIMEIEIPLLDGIKAGKVIAKDNLAGGVLIFSSSDNQDYIEEAKNIGAFGYLVKAVDNRILIPNVEMCINRLNELKKTKEELEKVTKKLEERKVVDKAKGMLIKEFSITEEEAYSRMRRMSMDKRTSMIEIGQMIISVYS